MPRLDDIETQRTRRGVERLEREEKKRKEAERREAERLSNEVWIPEPEAEEEWEKRVDDHFKKIEKEEDRKRMEESRAASASYRKDLADHKRKFRCHVCDVPSSGPRKVATEKYTNWTTTLWDSPKNLMRCRTCNNWTCYDHIHHVHIICKACAEKL